MVVVVIGDYKKSPLPSIENSSNDYFNVIRAFNYMRGYDTVFATNDGVKHLANENRVTSTNEIKSFDFKLKWAEDDVDDFNIHITQQILSFKNEDRYDSLIYILSCHGDTEKTIYDSDGEELSLEYIYDQFNNTNCKSLRQRPKIYLFDINKHGSDNYISSTTSQINNHDNSNMKSVNCKDLQLTLNDGELKQSIPSSPVLHTKTYTEQSHHCIIFGNSKQQPLRINVKNTGSLFISSISKVASRNFTFINSSLGDVLFETRQIMADSLSIRKNRVQLDEIVLNEHSTMPYDIKFSSCVVMGANFKEEKESKTNVCACCVYCCLSLH